MTEQYLIAHKVRGEPAFDIAIPMEMDDETWWIIPTSGHRAYPYWSAPLEGLMKDAHCPMDDGYLAHCRETMFDDLPDHYQVSAAPKSKGSAIRGRNILAELGLLKPTVSFKRANW